MDNFHQEEIKPAGRWTRIAASILDNLIVALPIVFITILLAAFLGSPILFTRGNPFRNAEQNSLYPFVAIILYFAYYGLLTGRFGATIGKIWYGLKVVRHATNERISYKRAFIREVIKIVAFTLTQIALGILVSLSFFFIIGFVLKLGIPLMLLAVICLIFILLLIYYKLFISLGSGRRGLQDIIVGTQVVTVNKPWPFGKSAFYSFILILGYIAVFGFGWFLNKTIVSTKPQPETSISLSPSTLKTYQDKELGWSIQYDGSKFVPSSIYRSGPTPHLESFDRWSRNLKFCLDRFTVDMWEN